MPRLDAHELVDRVAAAGGPELVFEAMCPGGEVGAVYVRWPDGRRSVLTFGSASAAAVVDRVVAAGHPVPRYLAVVDVGDDATAVVQEEAPGSPVAHVSVALVEDMLRWWER